MAYGMVPVLGGPGQYNSGGFDEFRITGTADIFHGDLVALADDGGVALLGATPTTSAPALGVFLGARWVTAAGDQKFGQFYDYSAGDTLAYAQVITNPFAAFRVQGQFSTAAAWSDALTGEMLDIQIGSGSVTTGNSGNWIDLDTTGASDDAVRVIDVVRNGQDVSAAKTNWNVIVRWNPGVVLYNTGITY